MDFLPKHLQSYANGKQFDWLKNFKDIVIVGDKVTKFNVTKKLVPTMLACAGLYHYDRAQNARGLNINPGPYLVVLVQDKITMDLFTNKIKEIVGTSMEVSNGFEYLNGKHRPSPVKARCDVLITIPTLYYNLVVKENMGCSNTHNMLLYYVDHCDLLSMEFGKMDWPMQRAFVVCCSARNAETDFFVNNVLKPTPTMMYLPYTPRMGIRKEQRLQDLLAIVKCRPPGERIVVICENEATNDHFGLKLTFGDNHLAIAPHRNAKHACNRLRAFQLWHDGARNVLVAQVNELKNIDIQRVQWLYNFDAGLQMHIYAEDGSSDAVVLGMKKNTGDSKFGY